MARDLRVKSDASERAKTSSVVCVNHSTIGYDALNAKLGEIETQALILLADAQ